MPRLSAAFSVVAFAFAIAVVITLAVAGILLVFFGAAVFAVFPFAHNAWLIGVLSFGIGLALGCGQPVTLLMSYNRSPAGRTGEVTGVRMTLNHFTHTTVPVVAGALGSAFGMAPVFVMIAAILAVSGYLSGTIQRVGESTKPPA